MNEIQNVFGGSLFGIILSGFGLGVLMILAWTYFSRFPSDFRVFRYMVVFLCFLQTLQLIIGALFLYSYLVVHFGDMEHIYVPDWQYNVFIVIPPTTAFIAHIYYAMRVRNLWKSLYPQSFWRLPVVSMIILLTLLQLATGFVCLVKALKIQFFKEYNDSPWETITFFACIAMCDITVAATMCYLLLRSRTGLRSTDRLIKRLVTYTVETGLLTSVFATASLIAYSAQGLSFEYGVFCFPLGTLYGIALLANLLARKPADGPFFSRAHADQRSIPLGISFASQPLETVQQDVMLTELTEEDKSNTYGNSTQTDTSSHASQTKDLHLIV